MQAVLKAQINKTDRNDARGIAQMMRVHGEFVNQAAIGIWNKSRQWCRQA
jgi:hypothetical protein